MFNLMDDFSRRVDQQPDHPAVIDAGRGETISYGRLRDEILAVAGQLEQAGVRAGDCVGLHMASGYEYIVINYALWRRGACVVPIPVELTPEEKCEICNSICLASLISRREGAQAFEPVIAGPPRPISDVNLVIPVRSRQSQPDGFAEINAAFIRFSSGTTGTSKGIVLSHDSIYQRIEAANAGLELTPDDRVIWLLSMSYHFAVSIVAYLSFGATIVLCKNHLGRTLINTTAAHSGTFIYGSPVHYQLMAHDPAGAALPSVRLAISTATALPKKTADAFYARFGIPLTQAYGIIEIGLPCVNLRHACEHYDAVGQVLPAYELKLDDAGQAGGLKEIKFRGPGFLDAYYSPWRVRSEIMSDGWFSTGDLGELDEHGCLFIRGRAKETINVSGMKFFPQEVERVLQSHEAVKEASVFPQSHERFGEVGHANVVLRAGGGPPPTEAELQKFCAQYLADFKVPAAIHVVAELPRTGSGKILRRAAMQAGECGRTTSR